MSGDDVLFDLLKRDQDLKKAQEALNRDISEFMAKETGIMGETTLLNIVLALKNKYEQKVIL
jgi:hypothetical protein